MASVGSSYYDPPTDDAGEQAPASVPPLWHNRKGFGRTSFGRTTSTMILERNMTREMCCTYGAPTPCMRRLMTLIPVTSGISSAIMSPTSSALKKLLGSGVWPPFVSYALSLSLSVIACVSSRWFDPAHLRTGILKKFIARGRFNFLVLTGGLLGLVPVLADTYAPDVIGVGLLNVGVVVGQTALSVAADRLGLFWRKPYELPWPVWLGLAMVVVGAVTYRIDSIVDFSKGADTSQYSTSTQLMFTGLAVLSGLSRTSQTALNRKLAPLLGRHRDALCLNYLVGTSVMTIVAPSVYPRPNFAATRAPDSWKYLSGLFSILGQILSIMATKLMGMTKSALMQIGSQICTGLVLDHFGLLALKARPISMFNVIGITIVLVGIALTDMDIPHQVDDEEEDT